MNIKYQTDEIAHFYRQHRNKWAEFYESERWVLERVAGNDGKLGRVLDVGCAAGGLGRALIERFSVAEYVGVDINEQAIEAATAAQSWFPVPCHFECADITEPTCLPGEQFDLVCSFSCADWNTDTIAIIKACWEYVVPQGYLIISLRLTPKQGVNDISRSYQYIYFGPNQPTGHEEKANYVVFNGREALAMLTALSPPPSYILGYGYWGNPSSTAATLYDELVFAVFAIQKTEDETGVPLLELHLPADLLIN